MPEALKDMYFTKAFIAQLGTSIKNIYPAFDQAQFHQLVYNNRWERLELKQRMRHITHCLHQTLPEEYATALGILQQVAPSFQGFDAMVFPGYVELYGLAHWELSMPALAFFTPLCSSEFAVRPFIAQDPIRAMTYLNQWAEDENEHIRRLASEGCRPRLPWAGVLSVFKNNPVPILPILEKLKDDASEYVRKSVANNLNDISKDHPEMVLEICERWYGQSKHTNWIIKHACRTLLKAGNTRALTLFGFGDPIDIQIDNLTLDHTQLHIGDDTQFTFVMRVDTSENVHVRLEYAIHYMKARGNTSKKVFQIREDSFASGHHTVTRKISFADLTTRKHHPGLHELTIIVNGVEKAKTTFTLV